MDKRSRRRIRDLVARPASLGLSENETGCARISMMARNTNVPFKGRIQKRKTYHLQIITFRLQRAAGPYSCANNRHTATTLETPRPALNVIYFARFQTTSAVPAPLAAGLINLSSSPENTKSRF
jgi:hypothetical protein